MVASVRNGKTDRELLEIWDRSLKDDDILPDLTSPKYGLTREEEKRATKLAQAAGRSRMKEIGHERGKRIAEDRKYMSGKY